MYERLNDNFDKIRQKFRHFISMKGSELMQTKIASLNEISNDKGKEENYVENYSIIIFITNKKGHKFY